jgi:uncharacterized protein (TIGR03086 family)
MSAEVLEQAFASTGSVLAGVTAKQMDDSTPCASWPVRALVNHIVGGTHFFAASATQGEEPPAGDPPDFTNGDFVAAFKDGAAQAVSAFAADGTMEKMIKLSFAELPGSQFVFIAALDTFTHGWDLAKATGQSTDLNPELAGQLLEVARMSIPDAFRGPDGQAPFGPKVEMGASACPADELAAFLGRQP